MIETWVDVEGYSGYYQISSLGRVKSIHIGNNRLNGRFPVKNPKDRILKQSLNGSGYFHVGLSKDGKTKTFRVHRLVALNLIQNPNGYNCVNHIDGVPKNNKVENLEWCTLSHNTQHAFNMGLLKPLKGVSNPMAKLTEDQVKEIRVLYATGNYKLKDLELKFNVKFNTISRVVNYKVYKDV